MFTWEVGCGSDFDDLDCSFGNFIASVEYDDAVGIQLIFR